MSCQLPRSSLLCPCRARRSSLPGTRPKEPKILSDNDDWEVIAPKADSISTKGSHKACQEDPRADPTSWPCFGEHAPKHCANQHGSWTKCTRCGVRLTYQKQKNQFRCNFELVSEAMVQLRKSHRSDEVTSAMVEDMIKQLRSPAVTNTGLGRECQTLRAKK